MMIKARSDKDSTNTQVNSLSLLGYYAGFISRLIAFWIDAILITIAIIATTWFVSITINIFRLETFYEYIAMVIPVTTGSIERLVETLTAGFLTMVFIIGYFVFFWIFGGQTPGKAMLGLRVVTTDGHKISPFRALLRYFGYFLSAGLLFFGFLWILIDDRRQGWHDKLAGTLVIYTWAARPDERFLATQIKEISDRSNKASTRDE